MPHQHALALIEQAPFDETLWPAALMAVAQATGGWCAQLAGVGRDFSLVYDYAGGIPHEVLDEFERRNSGHPGVNYRVPMLLQARPLRPFVDEDFMSPEVKTRDPFFNDFYRTWDAEHGLLARLPEIEGVWSGIAVLRSERQGIATPADAETLQALLPAVRSALVLQHRFERRGAELAAGMLNGFGVPAVLASADGRVVLATAGGEKLLEGGDWLRVRGGVLGSPDPGVDGDLQSALARAAQRPAFGGPRVSRVRLVSSAGGVRWAEISPLPLPSHALRLGAVTLVVLRDEASVAPRSDALADAFHLTPSEAEVALMVVEGRRVSEIATLRDTSPMTVRRQLQSVFDKTGAHSQLALAALMRRLDR